MCICICICICLIESLVFCYEELITRSHFCKGHGCCEREFLLMHVDVHLNLKPNLDLFSLRDSASFVYIDSLLCKVAGRVTPICKVGFI